MAIINCSSYNAGVIQVSYLGENQSNIFPFGFTPGPNTSDLSIIAPNTFGTTQLVEVRVDVDTDPAIIDVDWDAMDADAGWIKDINNYVTVFGDVGQSTDATLGYHITETGEEGQFTRTLTIAEGGVVEVDWLYPEAVPLIPKTWEWGRRNPKTQARSRMFNK